jgi:SAM-dependent methyltransferase
MSVKNCDNMSISPWIRRFCHLVPRGGKVLDLAAGGGRHSRWFLQQGQVVTALDRKVDGLERLKAAISTAGGPQLEIIRADLEDGSPWPLSSRRFDGVIVVNYLHRPLFPDLLASLDAGGVLLYDTFARGQEAYGRPSHPDFLLELGELLARTRGLQVVAFEQGLVDGTNGPAVRQRIAAIRGSEPMRLAPP